LEILNHCYYQMHISINIIPSMSQGHGHLYMQMNKNDIISLIGLTFS
jgi:hypothetical protein